MSDAAREQRAKNAQRKRWNSNLKVLSEKFSWKVDEYKLVNEIVSYMEQTFTFAQLCEIFSDDYDALIASRLEEAKEEHEVCVAELKDKIQSQKLNIETLQEGNEELRKQIANKSSEPTVPRKKFVKINKENIKLQQDVERYKRQSHNFKTKLDILLSDVKKC